MIHLLTPLEDPRYTPLHQPVSGLIPPVVARWGIASQRRWFQRFLAELADRNDWDAYYCSSAYHRGACCISCLADDYERGVSVITDFGWCCCFGASKG